jgi:hypothetical protein
MCSSITVGPRSAELYDAIKSREGEAGRPATDPVVLQAVWLYATVEGVGSARDLDRLSERDLAYRWLAGGVPLNYHGLADLRVAHVVLLDRLLTESVTALVAAAASAASARPSHLATSASNAAARFSMRP